MLELLCQTLCSRAINWVTNDRINNKYEVNDGSLVLVTGTPKESGKEKLINTVSDLATIGLATLGQRDVNESRRKSSAIKIAEELKQQKWMLLRKELKHGIRQFKV